MAPTCGLLGLALLAYLPALWQGGYIWDDDVHVTNNPLLRSLGGLWRIWTEIGAVPQYYPLVHTSFWLEYQLGVGAAGQHFVNVSLHGLSAILLWLALRRLGLPLAMSWAAAAVFAVHPVHVESVAWISERKNVLSLALYLGSLLAYLKFEPLNGDKPADDRIRYYMLALTLFVGALLSKTVTCSLPAAILLLIWWRRGRVRWSGARPLLPLFALGLAFGLLTAWMERKVVGAQGAEWDYSVIERVLVAGRAVWFYAGKILWPTDLAFIYPRWVIDASDARQYLFPLAAGCLLFMLWATRRRIGRGPLVAALFFGGTLIPALGFFDVYPFRFSFVADHFQYHASLGVIVLVVAVLDLSIGQVRLWRPAAKSVVWSIILATLASLTWRQSLVYENRGTLWADTINKNPESFLAHANLGMWLQEQGDTDLAIVHLERALELNQNLPEAHAALGMILGGRGDDRAMQHFESAIAAAPEFAPAHNGAGVIHARRGQFDEAIQRFRRAVELAPDFHDARLNLGLALSKNGRLDEAAEQFATVVEMEPGLAKANYLLGDVFARQGQDEAAIRQFSHVLSLEPGSVEAHYALGLALMRLNRLEQAAHHLEQVLRLAPSHAEALRHLESIRRTEQRGDPIPPP